MLLGLFAGLLVFGSSGWQLAAPPAARAQADAGKLYQEHCVKCHGKDGTGAAARGIEPNIPDFTAASWQAKRSDAQLLVSILDGKGNVMPAFRAKKISEEEARRLVAHVRKFAPAKTKPGQQERLPPGSFEERYQQLERDLADLQKQFHQLSKVSAEACASSPSEMSAARKLFEQHCVKCHGTDGTGSAARGRLREIPDFTNASWQERRSHVQLAASILDGKGKEMPSWRSQISEQQARALAAYVQAFRRDPGKSRPSGK
jgi:mono/diheme cytochrome c family protein